MSGLIGKFPIQMAVAGAGALSIGAIAALNPLAGAAAGAMLMLGLLLTLGRRMTPLFLVMLALGLIGYAFLGRGFAHLGLSVVYYGELLLFTGLLAVLFRLRTVRLTGIHGLILVLMGWCALQTLPYLGLHGVDALRDAAMWGYAFFALAVSFLIRREHFSLIVDWYRRILPIFIIWTPIALAASVFLGGLTMVPGTEIQLITARPGEWAVHLAGGAAFIIIGLWSRNRTASPIPEILLWSAWGGAVVLAVSMNRGSLLAVVAAGAVATMMRPSRHLLTAIFAGLLMISTVVLINPEVELDGHHRELSVEQLVNNVRSLGGNTGESQLDVTRQWRLMWWEDIIDYTVYGPYRWTGKGFGINLADDDGYQVVSDGTLRSPHNGHLTFLARSGIPGLVLWLTFVIAFGFGLVRAAIRAIQREQLFWFQVSIWLLAYWFGMLVNSTFEVYLEGPQGGIWFWTIVGLGIAVMRIQRESESADDVGTQPESDAPREPAKPGVPVFGARI